MPRRMKSYPASPIIWTLLGTILGLLNAAQKNHTIAMVPNSASSIGLLK